MAKKKNKIPPIQPAEPGMPLDQALPRGMAHFPPSRMDPDGGWTANPLEQANPRQKKIER